MSRPGWYRRLSRWALRRRWRRKTLRLSEDEALSLLDMCLTSVSPAEPVGEAALAKLAHLCAGAIDRERRTQDSLLNGNDSRREPNGV